MVSPKDRWEKKRDGKQGDGENNKKRRTTNKGKKGKKKGGEIGVESKRRIQRR